MKVSKSVQQFKTSINNAKKPSSAGGKKVTKAEAEKAAKILKKDGKVSKPEAKAVQDVLDKGSLTPGARETLSALTSQEPVDVPNANDGKLSPAKERVIRAVWDKVRTQRLTFRDSLPVGPRFFKFSLEMARHPDGYHYSAALPVGGNNPRFPAKDPDTAESFYIIRSGGLAGRTQYAGPFAIKL